MDFEQQVNQARDRSIPVRYTPVIAVAIAGVLAFGAGVLWLSQRSANSALRDQTAQREEENAAAVEDLHKYQLLASTLSSQIEQLRTEKTELALNIQRLEIQVTETKKQADTARQFAEQLSDANAELDMAEAKIKSLTAEINALRQLTRPADQSVAVNPK